MLISVLGAERALGLVEQYLEMALEFRRALTDKAAAHLALIGENTMRTPWLAAKLLSGDPLAAQDVAKALLKHLVTAKNRTAFEGHLFDSKDLLQNLEAFSTAKPPTHLWRRKGRYEGLFKLLAPRFLLAPDHVLDCKGVHVR